MSFKLTISLSKVHNGVIPEPDIVRQTFTESGVCAVHSPKLVKLYLTAKSTVCSAHSPKFVDRLVWKLRLCWHGQNRTSQYINHLLFFQLFQPVCDIEKLGSEWILHEIIKIEIVLVKANIIQESSIKKVSMKLDTTVRTEKFTISKKKHYYLIFIIFLISAASNKSFQNTLRKNTESLENSFKILREHGIKVANQFNAIWRCDSESNIMISNTRTQNSQ